MKNYLNKLYLNYITSSPQTKRKIIIFSIIWVVFLIWSWVLFNNYLTSRVVTVSPIKTETKKIWVEESVSVNGVASKTEEEIKTSFLTNKEFDNFDNDIFQIDSEVKENYDFKQKIELSNKSDLWDIIVQFLKLPQITQWDIKNLNIYLDKIKQPQLIKTCKESKCTLKEKLDIYDSLTLYNQKLVQQKRVTTQLLTDIQKFNSLLSFKSELDKTNICSDKDTILSYLTKLRLSREKKVNEQRFFDFKDKFLWDTQMINYILKVDSLISEKTIELNFSDLSKVKKGKIVTYTITLEQDKIKIDYYSYNNQLFEKNVIDSLSDETKNEMIQLIQNPNLVYFFWPQYIETEEGKIKVYIPKLVLLKDKGILDTLVTVYLSLIKDNCNYKTNLNFTNYETDIIKNNLILNYINDYKIKKSLLATGQIQPDQSKDISLFLKEYELLMNTVFIY